MSVMTWSARRNPAVATGIVGALLGVTVGTAITWFAVSASRDVAATSDAANIGLTVDEMFDALRQHSIIEYGAAPGGLSAASSARLQQDQMAREYGAVAGGAEATTVAQLLFEHTLREADAGRPSIATQIFEHTLRENGMR
jgi:hypothetical protein